MEIVNSFLKPGKHADSANSGATLKKGLASHQSLVSTG